jgi:iron complex outermembrane receptor protein
LNNRKEFDVRRSGLTESPSLSLLQYTFNSELAYSSEWGKDWKIKMGYQNIITDNTNGAETGILPLIPDYISWKSGVFSTVSKKIHKVHFNLGIRYDYEQQNIASISRSIPIEIIRYNNQFHNISSLFAVKIDITKQQSLSFNAGFATRNPAINERYSNGLHQGVSGIEEGDIDLKTEKSLKNTLEYKWLPSPNFSLNALLYHQYFEDYIFLNPQDEIRLTIRGAFPVFKYEQTDAHIYGLDISSQFTINHSFFGLLKYSYLRGNDSRNNTPLVFMPPNRLFGSMAYRNKKPIKLSTQLKLEELEFEINNRLVFKQKHILPEQDFATPPPSYYLLGCKISTNVIFPSYKIRFFVKADNLLNARYRDYLNRQRYFANDTGISVTCGINFKF